MKRGRSGRLGTTARVPPVCVLDWGIGGFGVVRAIRAAAPDAPLGYFSDSGFSPYGRTERGELRRRLARVATWLADAGCEHLVIACNAASSVAESVPWPEGLRISDVVSHGVALVRGAKVGSVGLVGGERTVRSGVYARRLAPSGIAVKARVAQPLSAYIERGVLAGDDLASEVTRIVAPLSEQPALLLACTHYPAIEALFRRALPRVRLLDPAPSLACAVVADAGWDSAASARRSARGRASLRAFTTGSARETRRVALAAFGVDPGEVNQVSLDTKSSRDQASSSFDE